MVHILLNDSILLSDLCLWGSFTTNQKASSENQTTLFDNWEVAFNGLLTGFVHLLQGEGKVCPSEVVCT